jgi:hypothetical protein
VHEETATHPVAHPRVGAPAAGPSGGKRNRVPPLRGRVDGRDSRPDAADAKVPLLRKNAGGAKR